MKKILAILLILVLALGCIGCGNNGDGDVQEPDGEGTGAEAGVNDGAEDGADESTEGADGETINPEDYYISDAYSDMEAEYDFDLKVESSFGLENVVQKVSYSDIGSLAAEVENRLNATAGSVLGTRFTVFSDYEEDDEDEIDKLAYAIGMESPAKRYLYCVGHDETAARRLWESMVEARLSPVHLGDVVEDFLWEQRQTGERSGEFPEKTLQTNQSMV